MKTTALIEKGKDGTFGIYTPDIKATIVGEGKTVAEAKADFENSVKEVMACYAETGEPVPCELKGITFEYKYDTASVFNELECINVTKFARLAGIYPSTMRQYARGIAYISEKQAHKIEEALHALGAKMQTVRL
jgi:predicted RNase H-like HicB family nuclease